MVELLDGGTGSFLLLDPMQRARKIILIDRTIDDSAPGTITGLVPRFSSDYPQTLTAHDIGLKDPLHPFYLLGRPVNVVLFRVSIAPLENLDLPMSEKLASKVPDTAELVKIEICREHTGSRLRKFGAGHTRLGKKLRAGKAPALDALVGYARFTAPELRLAAASQKPREREAAPAS